MAVLMFLIGSIIVLLSDSRERNLFGGSERHEATNKIRGAVQGTLPIFMPFFIIDDGLSVFAGFTPPDVATTGSHYEILSN